MRTTLTSIAFGLALTSAAQLGIGPGARFTWVDAREEFKLGYGLHVSHTLSDVLRLNLEGYYTPWEDVNYLLDFSGFTYKTQYEYTNWGLNMDLEYNLGRAWFLSGGLGYSSFHTTRAKSTTGNGTNENTLLEHDDRLLALNLGFGKRWRIGPGDLRTAIYGGVVGYNFDNEHNHWPALETYGVSVSYQVRIGGEK